MHSTDFPESVTDDCHNTEGEARLSDSAIPSPRPGLVINYCFLWSHEHARGMEEGTKYRPCPLVAVTSAGQGSVAAVAAPITHFPTSEIDTCLQLPQEICGVLGLNDNSPRWICLEQLNAFKWPGFDLSPRVNGRFDFGLLPPALVEQMRQKVARLRDAKRVRVILRH